MTYFDLVAPEELKRNIGNDSCVRLAEHTSEKTHCSAALPVNIDLPLGWISPFACLNGIGLQTVKGCSAGLGKAKIPGANRRRNP